jgi:radical SAM superfamily enzyme YgiQ (UPF0313 family)
MLKSLINIFNPKPPTEMDVYQNFIEWLKPEGIEYLKGILKKHGTLLAVWMEGDIPHPVHFREGMQIRNWMRTQPEFKNKDAHWLDDNWADFTKRAIDLSDMLRKN